MAKSANVQMKTSNAPETYPGVVSGKVMSQNLRSPRDPTLSAASSNDGEIFPIASTMESVISGKRCSVSTRRTPWRPYMKLIGCVKPK